MRRSVQLKQFTGETTLLYVLSSFTLLEYNLLLLSTGLVVIFSILTSEVLICIRPFAFCTLGTSFHRSFFRCAYLHSFVHTYLNCVPLDCYIYLFII